MNRADYPKNWEQLANRLIVERGMRCEWADCGAENAQPHPATGSLVVLAACHTCDCEPKCGNETHLLVLCQLHHLQLDAKQHVRTRATNDRQRQRDAGQLDLFRGI